MHRFIRTVLAFLLDTTLRRDPKLTLLCLSVPCRPHLANALTPTTTGGYVLSNSLPPFLRHFMCLLPTTLYTTSAPRLNLPSMTLRPRPNLFITSVKVASLAPLKRTLLSSLLALLSLYRNMRLTCAGVCFTLLLLLGFLCRWHNAPIHMKRNLPSAMPVGA